MGCRWVGGFLWFRLDNGGMDGLVLGVMAMGSWEVYS